MVATLRAKMFAVISSLALLCVSQATFAQLTLDNTASTLSFVTTKADHVAEVHTFDTLTGSVSSSGDVLITIELVSVNTLIPIRNERMQAMLFETEIFPQAEINASVDVDSLMAMATGESTRLNAEFQLSLHGYSMPLTADLRVTRSNDGLLVSTVKPVVVTADAFGLADGVEALREVAGLTRISNAVPVSFSLTFN